MQKLLDLFKQVYNRAPLNSEEFSQFCRLHSLNTTTTNSRKTIVTD